jgi:hypothetical protein
MLKPGFISLLNFPNSSTIPASLFKLFTYWCWKLINTTTLATANSKWVSKTNTHRSTARITILYKRSLSILSLLINWQILSWMWHVLDLKIFPKNGLCRDRTCLLKLTLNSYFEFLCHNLLHKIIKAYYLTSQ